jgi:DNA-binding CsgD family transcriptional regulator
MDPRPYSGGVALSPVLIGRDDLLALADRRMTAALAGTGQLLFLAGEAGIGKTRLLAEVSTMAAARGLTVVRVGAYPRDAEVAGGVLADLAAVLRRTPGTADIGTRMAQRLQDAGGSAGDAYRQRRLLIGDLADVVVSLAVDTGPALLAMEDLHWVDDLTLEVLDRVARRLRTVPMLVVGTYRSDELFPKVPMRVWRPRLLTQRLAEEARLTRLGRDQTAAMATAITGTVQPADLITAVHDRSDGIPLHVEEFLAFLADPDASGADLPDTLADVVLARVHDLSESARSLAGTASVIGRSFDVDLLTAIISDTPQGIDAALRELDERFVIQPCGTEYDFRHALIRDALYADLPPHRRRELHAKVADAAAATGFGDAFVSDQYEHAQQPGPAYRHALAAAADAATVSAHRAAVRLYRRAQRTAVSPTPSPERADLLGLLAAELAATDDNAAAVATYDEAYRMLRDLGADLAAAALVPPLVAARHLLGADLDERTGLLHDALALSAGRDDVRIRILASLSAAYMLDRRLDDAIEFGRQARSLASGRGDDAARLNADATLGSVLVFAGRMTEGWRLLEAATMEARTAQLEAEAARGYRMTGSCASALVEYDLALRWLRDGIAYAERTERWNDKHYMAAHLAHALWATGDWAAADSAAAQALADGHGGITTRIGALHVLGYLALGRNDWAAAEQQLDEARRLGEQMGELQRLSPALWGLAETALHCGRFADAIAWCEKGYDASVSVQDAAYLFPYVVTGTRAYLAVDDRSGARDWVDRVTRLIQLRAIPGTLPALDHANGLLHLADGHTGQAREALMRASTGWTERHRFWEGTQALLDLAYTAQRSRRPAEAAALRAQARTQAEKAGATTLLTDVPSNAANGDLPLTAREIEVARLIAGGATNREIAATLVISPKTVAAHVEHILAKLGAARRAEIATWATIHTAGQIS